MWVRNHSIVALDRVGVSAPKHSHVYTYINVTTHMSRRMFRGVTWRDRQRPPHRTAPQSGGMQRHRGLGFRWLRRSVVSGCCWYSQPRQPRLRRPASAARLRRRRWRRRQPPASAAAALQRTAAKTAPAPCQRLAGASPNANTSHGLRLLLFIWLSVAFFSRPPRQGGSGYAQLQNEICRPVGRKMHCHRSSVKDCGSRSAAWFKKHV